MRIGINALAVHEGKPGGDSTYVRALIEHLPQVGTTEHWVIFVTPGGKRQLHPVQPSNVELVVCSVPTSSLVARALWEQVVLPGYIRRARLDVLHAPVNVAPIATTTPIILTLLEAEPFMPSIAMPAILRVWWRTMRSLSARRAARVLAISEQSRHELRTWMALDERRLFVTPLGVDAKRFAPDGPARPKGVTEPYLLWVGRPNPRKNVPMLVEALALLRARGRPERLVVAGPNGWAEDAIRSAARSAGCEDAVVRRAPLADAELPAWYRGAAAFVFPSAHEAFGLPVLEALACGTAVVGSDIPALREVGDNAIEYIRDLSPSGVAEAILRVLDVTPAERGERRLQGLQRAQAYSWINTASATLEHYRAVA
ncbi:MAG: glycosyltransferase family 4 protein [Chloroflexi bacterium]|nr:glycosyltransferase family 4 protein [Chloroflexota bacterium]